MDLFVEDFGTTALGPRTQYLRLGRCSSCELFFDYFLKTGLGLGPAHEDAVDEEPWRSTDTRSQAFLVVLLNLGFVLFRRNARIELHCVQLKLRRFGYEDVPIQAVLI